MGWATREYSLRDVDNAGVTLVSPVATDVQFGDALEVINNWRACHAFPVNTLRMYLWTQTKKVDRYGLVAQRLKRLPAISLKLRLIPKLHLSQMQDIGGCRAVVGSIRAVRRLEQLYEDAQFKHRQVHYDDYIKYPRDTGYRGIHLIYRYFSDKNPVYNKQKVELQFRTRLQHAWATAVETVGTFKQQALKSGVGDEQWLRFFTLMGAALAAKEKTASVPGTPTNRHELVRELRHYVDELDVIGHLNSYRLILDAVPNPVFRRFPYFLLELKPQTGRLRVTPYTRRDGGRASLEYIKAEGQQQLLPLEERDSVLVSVDSMKALRTAYPNYFADTRRFVNEITAALKL